MYLNSKALGSISSTRKKQKAFLSQLRAGIRVLSCRAGDHAGPGVSWADGWVGPQVLASQLQVPGLPVAGGAPWVCVCPGAVGACSTSLSRLIAPSQGTGPRATFLPSSPHGGPGSRLVQAVGHCRGAWLAPECHEVLGPGL